MEAAKEIERRLAAILAADVAGDSRLMGVNEASRLRARKLCKVNDDRCGGNGLWQGWPARWQLLRVRRAG